MGITRDFHPLIVVTGAPSSYDIRPLLVCFSNPATLQRPGLVRVGHWFFRGSPVFVRKALSSSKFGFPTVFSIGGSNDFQGQGNYVFFFQVRIIFWAF